jgi:Protein of unknown function (DUF1553)/Protein of unknown function (DUF1549)/Planctomycete cytochrome C
MRTLPWMLAAGLVLSPRLAAADPVDYAKDVKPLLRERCYACHGALKQNAKLRLDNGAAIRKGGGSGPAVTPGKPEESLLLERVSAADADERMPPEGQGKPLTEQQIATLNAWVKAGARFPADEQPEEDPSKHWAFVKPVQAALPEIRTSKPEIRNPIDAFNLAELEKRAVSPLPAAEKHVLLRRVYLDLTGLPPTREDLHAFLNDPSADAYEKLVDRLLASPQYGERWARHWMDVWRYSDWYGRRSVPDVMNSYARIFRWRDWIVRSLNADKGYDRMVVEMLAADEVCPEDDSNIVATGFLVRNWFKWNYHQWMKDSVEHTAKAFLALTLNCCHCHDHKYDPIKQEEYFRFRAFFEPLELRHDRWPGEPDPGPFVKYVYGVSYGPIQGGMIRVVDEKLDAQTFMYERGEERNRIEGKPPVTPGAPAFLGGDQLKLEPVELPLTAWYPGLKAFIIAEETAKHEAAVQVSDAALEAMKQRLAAAEADLARVEHQHEQFAGRAVPPAARDALIGRTQAVLDAQTEVRVAELALIAACSELASYRARLAAEQARFVERQADPSPLMKIASRAERRAAFDAATLAESRADRILQVTQRRNDTAAIAKAQSAHAAAAQQVAAAAASLAKESTAYTPLSPEYPTKSTGRRAALARWIASPENPLTARVAVNHIWKWHFGTPLVESTFDFGRNGKRPSHPELLDYLAVELMKSGWKMKALHKLIVTSDAYRRASATRNAVRGTQNEDPDNRLLWHFPLQRMEAEEVRDGVLYLAGELDPAIGGPEIPHEQGLTWKRRSLYFAHHGESQMEFLTLFDTANPCDCYKRTASVLPQQALALSNSELTLRQGRVLARRLWDMLTKESADTRQAEFICAAFEHVLTRPPTAAEQIASERFLARQAELFRGEKLQPSPTPDGPSTDPELRARENLVIALYNHNDFVTVR